MKRIFIVLISLFLLTVYTPVYGAEQIKTAEIEYLADGSYFETIITAEPARGAILFSSNSVTKTKTSYYKNSKGTVLWYVRVTGRFTYGNGTAKCTSSSVSAASNSSAWKITSKSAGKNGAKAIGRAAAKRYYSGSVAETRNKAVTLTCSPSGNFL